MGPRTNKITTPFRFRNIDSQTLLTNEVGDYGFFNQDIIQNLFSNKLTIHLKKIYIRYKEFEEVKKL